MQDSYQLLVQMYPELTEAKYQALLPDMIAKSYKQIQAITENKVVGVVAFWLIPRLWLSGNSLDLDNFVVDNAHRSVGIGNILLNAIEEKAKELNCVAVVLDAYTNNFSAIKFYVKNDFIQKGFHFVKYVK
jgi:ribosomal protein S18 acetylase RimI-like enzyme